MPDEARAPPVLAFALGTLHAMALLVLVVMVLHDGGRAGAVLGGVGTSRGIALGAGLWLLSWGATWRATRGLALAPPPRARDVLDAAALWGGAAGASFVAWAALVVAPGALLEPLALLPLAFALGLAFAFGGLVGALFAALDLALLRVALRARASPAEA